MNIASTPLKELLHHLTFQITIIILVPLVARFFTKRILRFIRLKKGLANFISVLVMLFVYYKTLMIVYGN